jgi:hypothetical protein
MTAILGRLATHLAVETLYEVPSIQFHGYCWFMRHLSRGRPLLCCFFVRQCHQHVVHLGPPVRPGFYCSQPDHDAGGPPLLHLLFVAHCCRPPKLLHPS